MASSVNSGLLGWSSLDKVLSLFWQLLYVCQAFRHPCSRSPTTVHGHVMFQWFPSQADHFYTLSLGNKVMCENMNECMLSFRAPQVSKKLNFTLQSYNHTELLDTKTFQLVPFLTSSLSAKVSSTTAVFDWTSDDGSTLHVCLDEQCWVLSRFQPLHQVTGLQPGRCFDVSVEKTTFVPHIQINVTQSLQLAMKTGQCPAGWLAVEWSCYKVSLGFLSWDAAQRACERSAMAAHLANIKTDAEFRSITASLLERFSHLLLLWTALNDQELEGDRRWSDGSAYNLTIDVTSSLAANQAGCFAMQKNATGPGYFFTAFPCYLQLPRICQVDLLQSRGYQLYLESVCETEAVFVWSDTSQLLEQTVGSSLILRSVELMDQTVSQIPLGNTRDRLRVEGLFPGHVYQFSLSLTHPSGASQTLGPILIAKTKPNPPQNLTVTAVTSNQISVSWAAPDSTQNALFDKYILTWVDAASGRCHSVQLDKMNLSAVIGGLKSDQTYRITVMSVTGEGVQSSEKASLTVITAVSPPRKVSVEAVGRENMTVCWWPSLDEKVKVYYIQLHPWKKQDQTRELWVNGSSCITLTVLKPGETYEVGVAAAKGGNMSAEITVQQTLKPGSVQIAVPLEVGTHSMELFVQMPRNSAYDGITITYGNSFLWRPVSEDSIKVLVEYLNPGMQYDFHVFVTSREARSEDFTLTPVRTCLAPPTRVRAGVVTDSSIELLWDRAEGDAHHYEALCANCAETVMVQKVVEPRAVFKDIISGNLCNCSIRTEKEFFRDSPAVTIAIRSAPSSVMLLPVQRSSTSLTVCWRTDRGVCDSFIMSIRNSTFVLLANLSESDERMYHIDNLLPGSVYVIEVTSVSGDRQSFPANATVNTFPEPPGDITFIEQEVNSMYVMWPHPPGGVDGYRLQYGLAGEHLQPPADIHGNSFRIFDLTPGRDYRFEIQSFLGSDFSQTTSKNFSTRPAGVCLLLRSQANVTSATVTWEEAHGHFDFYRVTVSNSSHNWTFDLSPHVQEVTVSDLRGGCSYNTTVQRFRNQMSGTAATITLHTVPASPEGLRVLSVSPRDFSLRWLASSGCDKNYLVQLFPDHGRINITTTTDNYIQAQVSSVTPGTSYTVTVGAVASSGLSSPVSRILVTANESLPAAPSKPEGERVGSTGILLSWRMRIYKEMCPYPDSAFTEITKNLDIPETLLNTLTPGATYNIKVAAVNKAGIGPFRPSLYYKTAEAPPGLVSNLSAEPEGHMSALLTWYLPVRINGLITKFAVKVKHARTGQIARTLELNAEDIMNEALPHCNDAADILSRGTPSPAELTSAVLPSVTLSAVPPASVWAVPISVSIDELRPYTPYVFEVSAFTSGGEGQIASTMVRMPEAAPEDPPQNIMVRNITSKSLSLTWEPPKIITGRFSYVIQLNSSAGFISENSTFDLMFTYTGLTPYTLYYIHVMAKSAGATGPEAVINITTLAEAPSAVSNLTVEAIDSTSVRLSWRAPSQPNGLITHYRILVRHYSTLVQDITLRRWMDSPPIRRNARSLDITTPNIFTLTPHGTSPTSGVHLTSTDQTNTELTSDLPLTPSTPHTPPPWLTVTHDRIDASAETETEAVTMDLPTELSPFIFSTDQPPLVNLSPYQPRRFTRAVATGFTEQQTNFPTRVATTIGIEVLPATEETVEFSFDQMVYVIRRLSPFTEYKFSVTANNIIGEGPSTQVTVKTAEQVPSSVQDVSYQNISSTSVRVSWDPPLNPNGKITYYTVYAQNLHTNQELREVTSTTSAVLTGLEKYSSYKLRVAASTAVGESPQGEDDYIFVVTLEDEPDSPPRDLTVVRTTSSNVTLSWSPPEKPNGIIRQYEVTYSNGTYSDTVNSTSAGVTLRYLKPYTYYNVTVLAYTQHGHGEQISDTLQMLSGEDVPGSPPSDLIYESIGSSEVNVSWSPPLLANGIILFYNVDYWNATHALNKTTPVPFAVLSHLRKYTRYRVSVQAATRVGMGNHSSEILNITTLEDIPGSPPKFLVARKLSDTEVELSWKAPDEANSEILYYVVRVWNLSSEFVANVTETSVVVSVDGPGQYNASVSSWTRLGDGGLLIYITFSTVESAPSDPPQNVSFVLLTTSTVRLSWSPPTQPNGIIQLYTVYYTDNNTLFTQRVPGSDHGCVLSDLIAGQTYSVWMSSSTSAGDGEVYSPPLNFTTLEEVPSGPVHNLTAKVYSSTAVVISWDPPLEPNGKVFYLLSLEEAGTTHPSINRTLNATLSTSTTENIYLFTKLRKYFPYVIKVTPATGAGAAVNHTTMLHLRTNEDVPGSPPFPGASRNLSWASIYVTWFPPAEPNGEIIDYAIALQGSGAVHRNFTPETHVTLTDLTPFTPYNLSVAAVTRQGVGPAVIIPLHTDEAGPMSPPRNLSIFNHTSDSVWLQWEPSLEPNGIVQHYGFRILELNTYTIRHQNSSDASTHAELRGFRPHNSYEISVSTQTRAGNGEQYSLPVIFTTNESVSDAVGNLTCSGLDWNSVYMEWEPPVHPNGEILHYLIRSGDREEEAHPLTLTYTVVHTFNGLSPDAFYIISVAAVNSAGAGEEANCTAHTPSESVPGPPQSPTVTEVSSDSASLIWQRPARVPGLLQGYSVEIQSLARNCEMKEDTESCVQSEVMEWVDGETNGVTLSSLLKYREYRIRVLAFTRAGPGEPSGWIHTQTLAGNPDAPPGPVSVVPSATGLKVEWEEPSVISGPTSYLIDIVALDGSGANVSLVRYSEEIRAVVVGDLTAFTLYSVTVTAFTGSVFSARGDGKASEPVLIRTLEDEPKDPPKNVTLTVNPEEVTRVYLTFSPPDEPNGNISAYHAAVYRNGQLVFSINSLPLVSNPNNTMTAVVEGLKGGFNYSIRIAAVNGAGLGPSSEVQVTTGVKAPPKPTRRPRVAVNNAGLVITTSNTITIEMPECFFTDDHGPIQRVQVIVSEPAVMDYGNLSNWKSVFLQPTAPYLTDEGFVNPACSDRSKRTTAHANTYVMGADEGCLSEDARMLCNGPLKPKTYYVFKFRATNIRGQYTDSEYSERVRTADDRLLTRDEQIILGVVLSVFLVLFLIVIIYCSVRIHRRQKEGGTYSPREAEIFETKFKLDQLISVADMEFKDEKINRYSSFFFRRKDIFVIQLLSYRKSLKPISKKSFLQHVENLCANDNAKFQEEFAELPKFLQDLATSDADLPWNRSKNRFTNIKPYNNNRVKLLSEPGMPGSDFINASFVSGYLCPNEFIATQGPLPSTVADFWRMIWETGTKTIVMLTQCFEKGRIRCHQYWPEDNKPVTVFADIVITKLTEDVRPDWTVRSLRVERHGHYMIVHHFNYTSWPEHGVPQSSSTLIQFVKAVRSSRNHDNTTIVVHCRYTRRYCHSAGFV
ncbi:putative phosphatidylinositol phosphatase PTPRQ-like [Triplophysa rosa]|uniref:Phosphatidylinositol phosphatase PTPRQ-like n=1 Tax=Triplophysa rosa TaxID=992332 RepID=A0A9W7TNA2_TRIRA|nr:putative phosphatidylinositol phosphatase PTPRQ-like [Triplophysa rosa]